MLVTLWVLKVKYSLDNQLLNIPFAFAVQCNYVQKENKVLDTFGNK